MSRLPDAKDSLDSLPIVTIEKGTRLFRVNALGHPSSVFYSSSPENRWTPISGAPGVCYMAGSVVGALAESVCRNVAHLQDSEMIVSLAELKKRGMFELELQAPVNVLDLTTPHLGRYRFDAEILSDYDDSRDPPYRYCPAWAEHCVEIGLAGVLYRSRHKIDEDCLALFDTGVSVGELSCIRLDDDQYLAILEDIFDWAVI